LSRAACRNPAPWALKPPSPARAKANAGYLLTGSIKEEKLVFALGDGGNRLRRAGSNEPGWEKLTWRDRSRGPRRAKFAVDSFLEGDGFEPSVPRSRKGDSALLANSRFHHCPDAHHKPASKLEAAYHRADKAIQQIVDLLAA
jgi:hypothetical protein